MTDATWKKQPGSGQYDDARNWNGGVVPDGTASFGPSSHRSVIVSEKDLSGAWNFAANAGTYNFKILSAALVDFTGAGIVAKGSSKVNIDNEQNLRFSGTSSAGKAHITDNWEGEFRDQSTAGHATIVANHDLAFYDSSMAGSAHITNNTSLGLFFEQNSSADHATIIDKSEIQFIDQSSAGSAKITSTGGIVFGDQTSAGNATITMKKGDISLVDDSQGATSTLILNAGTHLYLDNRASAHGTVNIGAVKGAGGVELGGTTLQVGGDNKSMTFSGLIDDGGANGTLVKLGTGTLTLKHANNTFSGATAVDQGTLDIAAKGAAGTSILAFNGIATIKIENAALNHHAYDSNVVSGMAIGDVFDFAGLKFVKGAHATIAGGTLSVTSGKVIDTITLSAPTVSLFEVKNDGHGGTKVIAIKPKEKGVASSHDSGGRADAHHAHHGAELFHDFV